MTYLFSGYSLTDQEEEVLLKLNKSLDEIGINQKSIDPLYDRFLEAIIKEKDFQSHPMSVKEKKRQENLVIKVLKQITAKK